MTQQLPSWASEILQALEIDPVNVDIDTLKAIAATINDDPLRDHLLVGFVAGYAAGLAEGTGMASFDRAHAASVQFMSKSTSLE